MDLMELLILWMGSVLTSKVLDISLKLKFVKDIADQGYKIDLNRLKELKEQGEQEEQSNSYENKIEHLSLYLPIVNILLQFKSLFEYIDARPFLIDELRVMDCIIPFTKEEEESYKLKPTWLNAVKLASKSKIAKNKTSIYYGILTDDEGKNKILFKLEDGEFIIIDSKGPISKLSLVEQQTILEELKETIKNERVVDFNALAKRKTKEQVTEINSAGDKSQEIDDKIQELQEFKNLLTGQNSQPKAKEDNLQNKDGRNFTKKPKN